jgi:hypothetical protein
MLKPIVLDSKCFINSYFNPTIFKCKQHFAVLNSPNSFQLKLLNSNLLMLHCLQHYYYRNKWNQKAISSLATGLHSVYLWTFAWNFLSLGHDASECVNNEGCHFPGLHCYPQIYFHISLKESNCSARWILEFVPSFVDWRFGTILPNNNKK